MLFRCFVFRRQLKLDLLAPRYLFLGGANHITLHGLRSLFGSLQFRGEIALLLLQRLSFRL